MRITGSAGGDRFLRRLPVQLSSIEIARLGLLSYLQPYGIDQQAINRIEVVLEELISNVVRHAREVDELSIEVECLHDGVHLTIVDNGPAFNPLDAAAPPQFSTVEVAALGGQGIPLVKRLTRSLHYERIDGTNRLSTTFAKQYRTA